MTHGGPSAVYTGAEGTVALNIRRRHVDQCDIRFHVALFEQARYLVQENGNAIAGACVHRGSHVAADEKTDGSEVFWINKFTVKYLAGRESARDIRLRRIDPIRRLA